MAEAAPNAAGPAVHTFDATDGYRWRYRHFPADGTPRSRVVCIHGIQSHGGWYEHSCGVLRGAGHEVFFLDRRGSGMNAQDRGDAPCYARLLDDVVEFVEPLRRRTPWRPTFLLAISWGGKLGAALQRYRPGVVDGLILVCPGFFPRVGPSLLERVRIGVSFLVAPQALYPIPLCDPALFTTWPVWQEFLRQDPLALHRATARLFIGSVRLDRYLRQTPAFVKVPVLALLAGQDRIIRNDRTRDYIGTFASRDKEILEYDQAQHTLEFEPRPHPFTGDILGWLEKRTGGP